MFRATDSKLAQVKSDLLRKISRLGIVELIVKIHLNQVAIVSINGIAVESLNNYISNDIPGSIMSSMRDNTYLSENEIINGLKELEQNTFSLWLLTPAFNLL